jgi:arsenite-transporting ATPase
LLLPFASFSTSNNSAVAFQLATTAFNSNYQLSTFKKQHVPFLGAASKHNKATGTGTRTRTALNSIHSLVDDLSSSTSSSSTPRTIFVGGKGGVGKTTVSSSLAVTLSSLQYNTNNHKILVVSTDPAHSLGDALDVNLKQQMSGGNNGQSMNKSIVQMTDPITMGNLYAMEVNTDAAIQKFQDVLSSFTVQSISETYGISPELLASFGLDDISSLLSNPPPGLDELIALSQILNDDYIQSEFDIIVVDTAPTGHTLRMLALPEFLDGFLTKILALRQKLSGVISMVQTFMGAATGRANAEQSDNRKESFDTALSTIEDFRSSMNTLRQTLSNEQLTNFVIVTVPTKLSVNESKRLLKELNDQGINVSDIVVNQCVVGNSAQANNDNGESSMEAMMNYYSRRKANQMKWIDELQSTVGNVSSSPEYIKNGGGEIVLTQVPFFDVELVGTPALAYLGSSVFNTENFQYLMEESSGDSENGDAKFVICGGKGEF